MRLHLGQEPGRQVKVKCFATCYLK